MFVYNKIKSVLFKIEEAKIILTAAKMFYNITNATSNIY